MNLHNWHQRYRQQAEWTRQLRSHFFAEFNLPTTASILEAGCGTGAVLGEYANSHRMFGLDINLQAIFFCHKAYPQTRLICGDVQAMPFADASFDLTFCHYLLLWLADPLPALREMKRITRSDGWMCAFAEPDYVGRVAHPQALACLAELQAQSLEKQGAATDIGRQLNQLFYQCGLREIESGVLAFEWGENTSQLENELQMMKTDLAGIGKAKEFMDYEKELQKAEEVIYFIPTFYAIGRV